MAALTVPAFAPEMMGELGVPNSSIGNYVSALYVGAALATVIGGSLVNRIGGLRLSQISLLLCGAGLLLSLFASIPMIALGAVVIGLGYGPITPASSHLLARSTPAHLRSLMFSIRQTGVPAGAALAGIIVPPIVILWGWRGALVMVGLLCVLLAVVIQPLRERLDDDRKRGHPISIRGISASFRLVAQEPGLRLLAVVSFVFAGMQMCTSAFLVTYLVDAFSMPLVQAGTALAAASVGGIIFRIVWGWIADKWVPPRLMLGLLGLAMAIMSTTVGSFTITTPYWLVLLSSFALGSTAIGWNGVYLAEVARLAPPGKAGAATGGCLFFTFVGVVIIPVAFGLVQQMTGKYQSAFIAAAGACFIVGIVLTLTARGSRKSVQIKA